MISVFSIQLISFSNFIPLIELDLVIFMNLGMQHFSLKLMLIAVIIHSPLLTFQQGKIPRMFLHALQIIDQRIRYERVQFSVEPEVNSQMK
jgi:hypothetical protein